MFGVMFARIENELAIAERHLRVLEAVNEQEPVGLITLSNHLSYPPHKVRYSLRILETEDLIESTGTGVTTTAHATDFRLNVNHHLDRLAATVEKLRMDSIAVHR